MKRDLFEVAVVFAQLQLFVGVAFVFGSEVATGSLAQFARFRTFKGDYNAVGLSCHKAANIHKGGREGQEIILGGCLDSMTHRWEGRRWLSWVIRDLERVVPRSTIV